MVEHVRGFPPTHRGTKKKVQPATVEGVTEIEDAVYVGMVMIAVKTGMTKEQAKATCEGCPLHGRPCSGLDKMTRGHIYVGENHLNDLKDKPCNIDGCMGGPGRRR